MADPTQALASLRERLVFTRRIHSNESIRIGFQQAIDILDEEASKAAASSPALGATAPSLVHLKDRVDMLDGFLSNPDGDSSFSVALNLYRLVAEEARALVAKGAAPLTEDVEEGKT